MVLTQVGRRPATHGVHRRHPGQARRQPLLPGGTIGGEQGPARSQLFVQHRRQRAKIRRGRIAGQHHVPGRFLRQGRRAQHLGQRLGRPAPLRTEGPDGPEGPRPVALGTRRPRRVRRRRGRRRALTHHRLKAQEVEGGE